MAQSTPIEWVQNPDGTPGQTWNPVTGCTPVSSGCARCYAATIANRFWGKRPFSDVQCHEERLDQPMRRRKPTTYFVNSMSDLFHESVPFEFICRVFAVMMLCPQHKFMVLTKRPARLCEFDDYIERGKRGYWHGEAGYLAEALEGVAGIGDCDIEAAWRKTGLHYYPQCHPSKNLGDSSLTAPWPLPNVHLGTSVEDQKSADERLGHLMRCPAALRFVSFEPLLEDIKLDGSECTICCGESGAGPDDEVCPNCRTHLSHGIDRRAWLDNIRLAIIGGESGPGARPCNVEHIRSVVEQCKAAGVPCFVKQLGAHYIDEENGVGGVQAKPPAEYGPLTRRLKHPKGGDPSEWPADLRNVRDLPSMTAARAAGGE